MSIKPMTSINTNIKPYDEHYTETIRTNISKDISPSGYFEAELLENLTKGCPNDIYGTINIINSKIDNKQFVIDFLKNKILYYTELLEKYKKV